MDTECRTYDVPDAAKILGIGRNQAYERVRCGDLRSIRMGKRLLIPKVEIERILNGDARPIEAGAR